MRSVPPALALALACALWSAGPARADPVCVVVTPAVGQPVGGCVPSPFVVRCRHALLGSALTGFFDVLLCLPDR
ncbi:MAG: hypothetical protein QOE45_31 [Frankiaceae bacterium]|jgi:hypothetical protein|nr:hypothetical protein [Frankiaceae bacterium]